MAWMLALALLLIVVFVAALFVSDLRAQSRRRRPAGSAEGEPRTGAVDDALDLHGFPPREIPRVVESYVEAAAEAGHAEVRLIHGKGKGVQRRRVQLTLARHPLVEEFFDAPPGRGAWGATIARLRIPGTQGDRPDPGRRENA